MPLDCEIVPLQQATRAYTLFVTERVELTGRMDWLYRSKRGRRIASADILGQAVVIIISQTCFRIHNHIFNYRAKLDGVPNLRFTLLRKLNCLSITATLKVENTFFRPAVFIIANQLTQGVGGKGGFAGAGKTKEQSGGAVGANIGGTVHRANTALRHHIIHITEAGFFHLTSIGGSANQNFLTGEVQDNKSFRVGFIQFRNGLKARCANQRNLRLKIGQFFLGRAAQQMMNKKILPGVLINHAYRNTIFFVSADVAVKNKNIAPLQISLLPTAQRRKSLGTERFINLAPIHCVFGGFIFHHKTILRRASRIFAGFHSQSAGAGKHALPTAQCLFHQQSR